MSSLVPVTRLSLTCKDLLKVKIITIALELLLQLYS